MDLSRFLILVPTEIERRRLTSIGGVAFDALPMELCGFGPVAAGIATTRMLLAGDYQEVLLCGIAGSYVGSGIEIGQTVRASSIMLDGIGVDDQGVIKSGFQLGFQPALPDEIDLCSRSNDPHEESQSRLIGGDSIAASVPAVPMLTVCIASRDPNQAADRAQTYRAAVEEMEGFAVAVACRSLNVRLTILRGISNVAGDRDKSRWQMDAALEGVFKSITELVKQSK